eukprot:scaffold8358_cov102-Isochrysis_galbana.AAC.6
MSMPPPNATGHAWGTGASRQHAAAATPVGMRGGAHTQEWQDKAEREEVVGVQRAFTPPKQLDAVVNRDGDGDHDRLTRLSQNRADDRGVMGYSRGGSPSILGGVRAFTSSPLTPARMLIAFVQKMARQAMKA